MNKRDTFYYYYFLVHIPVTVFMDSCLAIPPQQRHAWHAALVNFHITANKDFLLADPPLWLQVFGWCELCFQLPVFFGAAWALRRNCKKVLVVMTVYGFNAALTTLVCLAYVLAEAPAKGLSAKEMWSLFALYFPYLVIPAVMMVDCGARTMALVGAANDKKNQ